MLAWLICLTWEKRQLSVRTVKCVTARQVPGDPDDLRVNRPRVA